MTRSRWMPLALLAQAVVIVLLAWATIYFAREELRLGHPAAAGKGDDPPAKSPAAAAFTVKLSLAAQHMAGIKVASPEAGSWIERQEHVAVVLSAQPLVDLAARLAAARHEVAATTARTQGSQAELARVQGLYDDDRAASQRALEQARAQAGVDAAQLEAARAALAAVEAGARLAWGESLAQALVQQQAGVAALLEGREVLVRVLPGVDGQASLPATFEFELPTAAPPSATGPVHQPRSGTPSAGRCLARSLGTAGPADIGGAAPGPLYRCDARGLAAGTRLVALTPASPIGSAAATRQPKGVSADDSDRSAQGATPQTAGASRGSAHPGPQPGVWLPDAAVVWQGGMPWAYLRTASGRMDEPEDDDNAVKAGADAAMSVASSASGSHAGKPTAAARKPPKVDAGPVATFERRPLKDAQRVGQRWFAPGLGLDDPVVVQGAQLLLSEEYKFQIRNENDD